jgi:hypothetical protein
MGCKHCGGPTALVSGMYIERRRCHQCGESSIHPGLEELLEAKREIATLIAKNLALQEEIDGLYEDMAGEDI